MVRKMHNSQISQKVLEANLMRRGRRHAFESIAPQRTAHIVRLGNGQLAEHWDVIEDEATKEASVSGLPMFGTTFPSG